MSRRAMVKPDWLDRLLIGWGLRSLNEGCNGWYSVNPMLKDAIPTARGSADLCDFGTQDYDDLDAAIRELPTHQLAAITRAYKPWAAPGIDRMMPALTSTWCERLKAAAVTLAAAMDRRATCCERAKNLHTTA